MTTALRIANLSKTFDVGRRLFGPPRAQVRAVRPLSLTVETGETLGIVGESGCGKSTLARMLVGLEPPTTGTIEIEGRAFDNADPAAFGRMIQYVFQDPISSLNPRKSIRAIMDAPLRQLHGMDRAVRAARISEIFASVNLRETFLDRFPHEFSGGQAQRIGVARALAAAPRILVLDEPVSALDVSVQAQVLNLMKRLQTEMDLTYLFISHDLSVVRHMADVIAVMYLGRIVEIQPTADLFSNPLHPYTRLLLDTIPDLEAPKRDRSPMGGEVPSPVSPPSGCSFHPRCPLAFDRCKSERPQRRAHVHNRRVACFAAEEGSPDVQ